jgi:3D (Asp-Asp-Asp) domain-containing protein
LVLPLVILVFVLAVSTGCVAAKPEPRPRRMTVRTTAYTAGEPGGSFAANGSRLRFGGAVNSAAADWSWMPVGTRFRVVSNGREYVVEDFGSALVGRETLDLYFPTFASMHEWGTRVVEIDILEWGSYPVSKMLLDRRLDVSYVRRMADGVNMKLAKGHAN